MYFYRTEKGYRTSVRLPTKACDAFGIAQTGTPQVISVAACHPERTESMKFKRDRYQQGALTIKQRQKGDRVWEFRYYDDDNAGNRSRRGFYWRCRK